MTDHPDLERFVELLIGSVPALALQSTQDAHSRLQGGSPAQTDRKQTAELLALTRRGAQGLAGAFSAAMRQHLREETSRATRQDAAVPGTGEAASLDSLTLVDDQQIEEDIELARVIQLVETDAEADLRELYSLCATLRGANAVSPELHPMRPEVCARSLSRALQGLNLTRAVRLLALRAVGKCLAERLCQVYREQLRELRRWGVPPLPYQLRVAPDMQGQRPRDDAAMQRLAGKIAATAAPGADAAVAAQLIPRLLAQVAEQAGMDATLRALVSRLAAPATRSARAEPGVLASFQHPVWRLVDRMAALGAVQAERGVSTQRLAQHLEPMVARLERTADSSFAAYEQALLDLDALATGWADSQLSDAGLARDEPTAADAGHSLPTDWAAVDSLPTVPMELPGAPDAGATDAQAWVTGLREGDLLRLFLHARWTTARLTGRSSAHMLLSTRKGEPLHTLSRRALGRLRGQGLATAIESIQPVREAVDTLTLDLDHLG